MGELSWKHQVGRAGEELAARFLLEKGWVLLERNWRGGGAEIDLIFQDGQETVFVEVKTRRSHTSGYPEESITATKRRHIERAAECWWQAHPPMGPWRVDVVAIRRMGDGPTSSERRDGRWDLRGERWEIMHFVGI